VFGRGCGVIKPFNQCCGCKLPKKNKQNAVVPDFENSISIPAPHRLSRQMSRELSRRMSRELSRRMSVVNDIRRESLVQTTQKTIIKKVDELGEIGATYYSPHTEILPNFES
jgi:hypothetical protein